MHVKRLFTRNFTLLVWGQIFSLLGNYTLKFALSMYVLEQTGSASRFAAILAASTVPVVLLSPVGGVLADRINRRTIMIALDTLSGISVGIVWLLWGAANHLTLITILQIVLGIFGAFESPTVQACVPQMHRGENLMRANSVVNQVQALAAMVTPFTGSIAYTLLGIQPVLMLVCGCFFCTALLELFLVLPSPANANQESLGKILCGDLKQSIHFLGREEPMVLQLLLLAAAANFFASGIVSVGLPFLVRTVLRLPTAWYGAAESVLGTAAVMGSLFIGIWGDKIPLRKQHWLLALFGVGLLPAAAAFVLVLSPALCYAVLLAGLCVGQATCSMFSVVGLCAIQQRTPEGLTGKVMAFVMTLALCVQPLGQVLYGIAFDFCSPAAVLGITGLLVLFAAYFSRNLFKQLSRF